jgi:hypothetical protein
MTKSEQDEITGLEKQIDDLTSELTKATAAVGDSKKAAEALAAVQKQLTEANAKLAKIEADEKLIKAMAPAEKDYCDGLVPPEKAAFLAMSPEDRKKAMQKKLDGDEVIKVEGQEIRKSVVGDSQFAIFKAQSDRLKKAEDDITKERDAREMVELKKRADDEFKHVPGTTDERAGMLKVLAKLDEPLRKAFEAVFVQSEKLAKVAFEKVGNKGSDDLDKRNKNGISTFEKKIDEIQKGGKNMSRTDAMAKARVEYPTEFAAYQAADSAS